MNQTTLPAVLIQRHFDAPPARVYEAFANINMLSEMIVPEGATFAGGAADVREGGEYHLAVRMADGDVWTLRGSYREVSPANRLSFTWTWVEDDPKDEQHTLLTLDFAKDGDGTELTLKHELFLRERSRNSHEQGWGQCLDRLAAQLAR